jgi:hypothetical protein
MRARPDYAPGNWRAAFFYEGVVGVDMPKLRAVPHGDFGWHADALPGAASCAAGSMPKTRSRFVLSENNP